MVRENGENVKKVAVKFISCHNADMKKLSIATVFCLVSLTSCTLPGCAPDPTKDWEASEIHVGEQWLSEKDFEKPQEQPVVEQAK